MERSVGLMMPHSGSCHSACTAWASAGAGRWCGLQTACGNFDRCRCKIVLQGLKIGVSWRQDIPDVDNRSSCQIVHYKSRSSRRA